METTPYGIRVTPDGRYEVWQEWWGKLVGGPFAMREEAEADCIAAKRSSRRSVPASSVRLEDIRD